MMTEEAKKAHLESVKKWRRNNPEKYREQQKRYRQSHKEQLNASHKKWRDANPDKVGAINARYWAKKAKQFQQSVDSSENQ